MAGGNGQRRKRGRVPKIGGKEETQILAVLEAGGSLRDASGVAGIDYTTLYRRRKADPKFAMGVRKALRNGKFKLIQRVTGSKCWQSAAWYLERRWGREFGRKDRHDHRFRGSLRLLPMKLDGDVDLDEDESNGRSTAADADALPQATRGDLLSGPVHRN